jgi:hypothetical protein
MTDCRYCGSMLIESTTYSCSCLYRFHKENQPLPAPRTEPTAEELRKTGFYHRTIHPFALPLFQCARCARPGPFFAPRPPTGILYCGPCVITEARRK